MKYIKESNKFKNNAKILLSLRKTLLNDITKSSKLYGFDIDSLEMSLLNGNEDVIEDFLSVYSDYIVEDSLKDEELEYGTKLEDMTIRFKIFSNDKYLSFISKFGDKISHNAKEDLEVNMDLLSRMEKFIDELEGKGYEIGHLTEEFEGFSFRYNISTHLDKVDNIFRKFNEQ